MHVNCPPELAVGKEHAGAKAHLKVRPTPACCPPLCSLYAASGELYSWGWPANGRLGHSFAAGEGEEGEEDLAARCAWEPRRVDLLRAVRLKQVGGWLGRRVGCL